MQHRLAQRCSAPCGGPTTGWVEGLSLATSFLPVATLPAQVLGHPPSNWEGAGTSLLGGRCLFCSAIRASDSFGPQVGLSMHRRRQIHEVDWKKRWEGA